MNIQNTYVDMYYSKYFTQILFPQGIRIFIISTFKNYFTKVSRTYIIDYYYIIMDCQLSL